jgi:hypothetical protein
MKCFITSFTRKAIQVTDILNVSIWKSTGQWNIYNV